MPRLYPFAGLILLAVASAAAAQPPVRPPPSVALNPAPLPDSAPVAVLVDTIPASAKYVMYVGLKPRYPSMTAAQAAATGRALSRAAGQLSAIARRRGANVVVLLGSEHGIPVPIDQAGRSLMLQPDNPLVTALLFPLDGPLPPGSAQPRVRFTTAPAPPAKDLPDARGMKQIAYAIHLGQAPLGLKMAQWVYGNIARFVADATAHGFDAVSLRSTTDAAYESVWLPACDAPLKISMSRPELAVTVYRRPAPAKGPP